MVHIPFSPRRLLLVAGVALGALAPAAVGVSSAAADTPPLSIRSVRAGGTEADAFVFSVEPTMISYSVRAVTPLVEGPLTGAARPPVSAAGPLTGAGAPGSVASAPLVAYDTKHQLHLTGLKPNTTYDLNVAGTTVGGQGLTAHARFTTLKQRLRVTLDKIVISNDGDVIGSGEPAWFWSVGWTTDHMEDCYPQSGGRCRSRDFDAGTVYPYTSSGRKFSYVFAEENFHPFPDPTPQPGEEDFTSMPAALFLRAKANESDSIFQEALDAIFDGWASVGGEGPGVRWDVPQGVEYAGKQLTIQANDDNFKSVMYVTFEVFYNNETYVPNQGRVNSTSR